MKYTGLIIFFHCSLAMMLFASTGAGQNLKETTVRLDVKDETLDKVFDQIQSQSDFKFVYNSQLIEDAGKVSTKRNRIPIEAALNELLQPLQLTFQVVGSNILITKKPKPISEKSAAAIPITGKVTDETGEPLPGVTIKVNNGSQGTITDVDGSFRLNAQENDVLTFSYIGYKTKTVKVTNVAVLNVRLEPDDNNLLNEVVVVGYGTQKRESVVGAIDQVTAASLEGRPSVNATQALQGVSPNLIVQQRSFEPGGAINLNIRGISTLNNNSPLVVIDGIVGGDINLLNPSDIESISVLKDAGSAAIYGSRANNGVVLVTTRKGKKNSRASLTYNALAGVNQPHLFMKPVSAYENAMLRNESARNAGLSSAVFTSEQIRQFREAGDQKWFADEILQNAVQQNHNLSVTGGNETSTYLVSVGYTDQESNFVGPDKGIKRYNYRLNMTNEFGKFKLTSLLSYARREITDHSFASGILMGDASRVPVYYTQKDAEGRYLTNDVLQEFNPLGILEQGGFRKYDDDNIFGNLSGELNVTKNFKLRGVFGGALYSNHQFARTLRVDYFPKGTYGADQNTNDESRKSLDLNTQLMAEYSKVFAQNHDVNLLFGASNENHSDRGTGIYKRNTDPDLGIPGSETIINPDSYNSNQSSSENSLNSLFGRATYSYSNKYFGEFSFRYDGSSKFREGNRWGFFPSVSLGYRLSNETFMKDYQQKVGDIKLRASYGVLGNQNVGNYQYQTTFFPFQNAYGFDNKPVAGTGYNYANPDIRWEKAATFNVGADLDFLKNKLSLSLDYFNKVTSDILVPPAVPGVFGTGLPDFNAGKVGNQGWEVSASYRHTGRLFRHTFSLNLADSWNEVLEFQGDERLTGVEELQVLLKEGYPFRSYVGFKRDGYFQTIDEVAAGPKPPGLSPQPGDNRYVDIDGDGVIDNNDLFVFGNPFPRMTFGGTYNVAFKGFDLNLFVQGVGKRTMMLRGELVEPFHFNYGMTMYEHQLDYWTPQNPNARYPRLADNGSQSNTNNFRRGSDMYLYDGAYLRMKNIQLGYTLPAGISKKLGMQKFRAYLSGQNLFTISKVGFIDPELTEFDSSLNNSGANSGRAYPTNIYYGVGLDITF